MPEDVSPSEQKLITELNSTETILKSVSKEASPQKWAEMMNLKGIILLNLKRHKEAGDIFAQALSAAGDALKIKILINHAKSSYYAKNPEQALELLSRVFQLFKSAKKIPLNLFMAHAHMLRGQIFFHGKQEKKALADFRQAEFYFEAETDLKGVGLACMEIARIHINNKNMTTGWNYLKKSENCFRKFGDEESMGVAVCKATALLHAGREDEAQELLKKTYERVNEFGMARYMIYEVLDAYLDIRTRMPQFSVNLT